VRAVKTSLTGRERFHATVERKPVDRPAWWIGAPLPETAARSEERRVGKEC